MDPYENIVIGNFLYSFGLCIGQLSAEDVRPMCVNLLQQSPMDHALGDLMVSNAGVTRLIEFKRERNPSEKEEEIYVYPWFCSSVLRSRIAGMSNVLIGAVRGDAGAMTSLCSWYEINNFIRKNNINAQSVGSSPRRLDAARGCL